MEAKRIDDALSVSPQVALDDLPALKIAGFRSIICNRPDG
ncbi:MAG: sulfur transferase domain-containing protein, partial [Alphaproteobacteria bacterium]